MLVPLFGSANFGKSSNVSAQRRINLYTEPARDADKAQVTLHGRPGIVSEFVTTLAGNATTAGAVNSNVVLGPIRGMAVNYALSGGAFVPASIYGVMGNVLFQYAGGTLTLAYPGGGTSPLTTSVGACSVVSDGLSCLFADGVHGYYAASAAAPLTTTLLTGAFPQTSPSVCVVAGHYVAVDPTTNGRFYWSNALDVTTWDPLSFATAESAGDPLGAVFESSGELLLFGSETLEFWAPTQDINVFQRVGGSNVPWGTQAKRSVAKVGAGVVFLARNRGGELQVVQASGYSPQVISDPDVERGINTDANPDGATALSYTVAGHQFYQLNLSATSWVFDLTSGVWQEFQTEGSRHAAEYCIGYNGLTYVSDYRNSQIGYLNSDTLTDFGATIVRQFQSRHVFVDAERTTLWRLFLDCQTGVGVGIDPQIMLQVSKDGGHTFGNEMWTSLGSTGNYLTRAVWRRLGRARDWVLRFRITDPIKVVILGALVELDK